MANHMCHDLHRVHLEICLVTHTYKMVHQIYIQNDLFVENGTKNKGEMSLARLF